MLTLAVQPSHWLKRAIWALTGLAAVALMLAELPLWLQGLGLALLMYVTFRGQGQGGVHLQCQADGSLAMRREEEWRPVALLPGSIVNPWLSTIRYRSETGKRAGTLVLLPDSLAEDDFRRLRVWLKWKAVARMSNDPTGELSVPA